MAIAKNDTVSIANTELTGTVNGANVDQTTLEMQYLVAYTDVNGKAQERYFNASDLVA
tara:strand:- start:1319 stop:1492 length:174 start_codon:yes stop_codon:yes gene_type:complete